MNEEIKSICVGYCITKLCWNKGITTEATKAVIDFFFSIGFNRIFSYHNPLNPASGKVMQKCGMLFEGKIRGGSMLAGEICDCLQYAILADDYYSHNKHESKKAMKKPLVISISGLSGSGKTAVTNALKAKLDNTAVISFDDYGDRVYLDRDINDWSVDSSDDEWHTEPIAADIEQLLNEPLDYIILDYPFGYLNRLVGQYINLTVFIDIPLDVALARRIIRDYTSRDENTNVADVEEVSLKGLDRELRFYLTRSRPTYARMPEMQIPASDLIVDGKKTPEEIADTILSYVNTRS